MFSRPSTPPVPSYHQRHESASMRVATTNSSDTLYHNILDQDLSESATPVERMHHINISHDSKDYSIYDQCLSGVSDTTTDISVGRLSLTQREGKLLLPSFEAVSETSVLDVVQDVIIGLSDGLTVPFALAAGLAALDNSKLVVLAGLAEIAAGAISMGLGGYLAALSEQEYFDNQREAKALEVKANPAHHCQNLYSVFKPFGVSRKAVQPLVEELSLNGATLLDFIMKFDLVLEKPSKWRALMSALTIGSSYFVAGLIPLIPYMLIGSAKSALRVSIGVTLSALFFFGLFKAMAISSKKPLYSAVHMVVIGGLAALVAYAVASLVPSA
ncbi:hypothetical protein BASA50_000073 [Batrachochytrium salamandrivorans]|uniref:TIGR00267 family protein n=1 Tax=Batrachochytrium salamandrivorans TaxID=1357716 RepID=A0ABQ8EVI9_9FUNG|nr:hypothetical protein BASA50_000073 [Batrachochytrium salamandrivorans]